MWITPTNPSIYQVIPEIIQVCSDNENLTTSVSKGALQDGGIESSEACDLVSEVGVSQSALVFENSGPQINEEVSVSSPAIGSKDVIMSICQSLASQSIHQRRSKMKI